MRVTKYEHACLDIEEAGQRLIIDPGVFSTSLPATHTNVVAIIITHVHADHLHAPTIQRLQAQNPKVKIFSTEQVAEQLKDISVIVAKPGTMHQIGAFTLAFLGGEHAIIHASLPVIQNLSVLINTTVFYPGDSLTLPGRPIPLLALPAAAPWLKVGEVIDYIDEVKPAQIIPVHDFILSDAGKKIHDNMLVDASKKAGATYTRLKTGQSITV